VGKKEIGRGGLREESGRNVKFGYNWLLWCGNSGGNSPTGPGKVRRGKILLRGKDQGKKQRVSAGKNKREEKGKRSDSRTNLSEGNKTLWERRESKKKTNTKSIRRELSRIFKSVSQFGTLNKRKQKGTGQVELGKWKVRQRRRGNAKLEVGKLRDLYGGFKVQRGASKPSKHLGDPRGGGRVNWGIKRYGKKSRKEGKQRDPVNESSNDQTSLMRKECEQT